MNAPTLPTIFHRVLVDARQGSQILMGAVQANLRDPITSPRIASVVERTAYGYNVLAKDTDDCQKTTNLQLSGGVGGQNHTLQRRPHLDALH